MDSDNKLKYRTPLHWGELDPHRKAGTHIGMWAWIWQRISAIAIIFLIGLHMTLTYKPIIQLLLLITLVFHAALGLRVILLDFNLVNVRYRNALIAGLVGLGIAMIVIIWIRIY